MTITRMSDKGLKELIGHEGIVQTRYKDSVGVWTIGVGHTKAAGPPDPKTFGGSMSLGDVKLLFEHDVARYEHDVASTLKVAVSQGEFDAMVSFHFNTGRIKTASFVKSLNKGDRAKAAEEIMNWKSPPSIIPRRQKEQRLFQTGAYANGGKAILYKANQAGAVDWSSGTSVSL